MRKTGIFLALVAVALLAWEGYALLDPDDDVALITTVIRYLNWWTGGLLALLAGGLAVHFFWHGDWRRRGKDGKQ